MRIQHNIMSMNAYRNYSNNTSALSKNLEKLSSGYKVNRAGDDAAGLAISEKMRAQITGLEAAQKNVKDGISLVNTAEGALQEVQDMLNRMVYLAQESANGTFDNSVDRKALQDEVNQLREEIDRIANSSNFNGIKLLDGSLSGTGGSSGVSGIETSLATTDVDATKGKYTTAAATATELNADGNTNKFTLSLDNGASYTVELTFKKDGSNGTLVAQDGTEYKATAGGAKASEVGNALVDQFKKVIGGDFTITQAAGKLTLQNKTGGTAAPAVAGFSQTKKDGTASITAVTQDTKPVDASVKIAGTAITVFTGDEKAAVFTINGKKFIVASSGTDVSKVSSDITVITAASAASSGAAQQLAQATGLNITGDGTDLVISSGNGTGGSGGLMLQIGDSSDSYNQLRINVGDTHCSALGIAGINIGTQTGAQAAVDVVKRAINTVSSIRGNLGAYSNRLDHTANNLAVMRENIQDAESTIRDTDVAEEMMAYTKNNILVQSAQAMLAQANQVPQGVLQLLQ